MKHRPKKIVPHSTWTQLLDEIRCEINHSNQSRNYFELKLHDPNINQKREEEEEEKGKDGCVSLSMFPNRCHFKFNTHFQLNSIFRLQMNENHILAFRNVCMCIDFSLKCLLAITISCNEFPNEWKAFYSTIISGRFWKFARHSMRCACTNGS